jgi:ectoine hydroxylase-related dioxygenase (phytanoyl-CoA dioxygenase family)
MGRGTTNLLTAWVPYGDVPRPMGGLAILEGSHRHREIREEYGRQDVDTFCENLGEEPRDGEPGAGVDPILDQDATALRRRLGGRWLTTDFAAGDLLLFGMFTAHASLDNRTNRWRLSSDSRYQLAAEPIDERWVGENPVGHTKAGKRGMIC